MHSKTSPTHGSSLTLEGWVPTMCKHHRHTRTTTAKKNRERAKHVVGDMVDLDGCILNDARRVDAHVPLDILASHLPCHARTVCMSKRMAKRAQERTFRAAESMQMRTKGLEDSTGGCPVVSVSKNRNVFLGAPAVRRISISYPAFHSCTAVRSAA